MPEEPTPPLPQLTPVRREAYRRFPIWGWLLAALGFGAVLYMTIWAVRLLSLDATGNHP